MKTDSDTVKDVLHRFVQVAGKFTQIESLPIRVNAEHVVSTREAHVIEAIGGPQVMNVSKLAAYFGITRSAASQMVSKLEKRGFITKSFAPDNAKEYQLSLTELGHEAFAAHERVHGADQKTILDRMHTFSFTQLTTLAVLLESLSEIMDERLDPKNR